MRPRYSAPTRRLSSPDVEDARLRLRPGRVDWRRIEDEIVVLDLERNEYIAVNPSGALLWPLLAGGSDAAQLAVALQDAFAVDEPTARRDVAAFLASLDEQGLLERADEP
jgi:hypothetical protein